MGKKIIKEYLILFCVILLQIVIILYWANEKGNYYWDEYFTFLNAHDVVEFHESEIFPGQNKSYEFDVWTDDKEMFGEFVVTKNNSFILGERPVWVFKEIITQPYAVLINLSEALFFDGGIVKWSGIVWNISLFILNQIVLFQLACKLFDRCLWGYIAVAVYGFSGICVTMSIFVRQYSLSILVTTTVVLLHWYIWESRTISKLYIYEFISLILVLWMFPTNPLVVMLFACIFVVTCCWWLLNRKPNFFMAYCIPVVIGILGVVISSKKIQYIITNFNEIVERRDNALSALIHSMYDLKFQSLQYRLRGLIYQLMYSQFGNKYILLAFLVLLLVLGIRFFLAKAHNMGIDKDNVHLLELMMISILFLFFSILFEIYIWERYISIIFPVIALIICSILYMISLNKRSDYIVTIAVVLLIVIGTNSSGRIGYLYSEDKVVIEKVNQLDNIEYFYVDAYRDWTIDEALVWCKDYKYRYLRSEEGVPDYSKFPDRFVAWFYDYQNVTIGNNKEIIEENGYKLTPLGNTYLSEVVLCEKN